MPYPVLINPVTRGVALSHTEWMGASHVVQPGAGQPQGHVNFDAHPLHQAVTTPPTSPSARALLNLRVQDPDATGPRIQDFFQKKPTTASGALATVGMSVPWLAPVAVASALVNHVTSLVQRSPKLAAGPLPGLAPYNGEARGATVHEGGLPGPRPLKEEYLADPTAGLPQHSGKPERRWVDANEGLVPHALPTNLGIHLAVRPDGSPEVNDTPGLGGGGQDLVVPKWGTRPYSSLEDPKAMQDGIRMARETHVMDAQGRYSSVGALLDNGVKGGLTHVEQTRIIGALETVRRVHPVDVDLAVVNVFDTHPAHSVLMHKFPKLSAYRNALRNLSIPIGRGGYSTVYPYPDGKHAAKVFSPVVFSPDNFWGRLKIDLSQAQLEQLASETALGVNELSKALGSHVVPPVERVTPNVLKVKIIKGVDGSHFDALGRNDDRYGEVKLAIDQWVDAAHRHFGYASSSEYTHLTGALQGWRRGVDSKKQNFLFHPETRHLEGWVDPIRIVPPKDIHSILGVDPNPGPITFR